MQFTNLKFYSISAFSVIFLQYGSKLVNGIDGSHL
jgi:hypothetical protein